ncbi:MAG: DUF1385 domain-containing protein [Clostridiales bacterium]|nr:DUF1385 domain-containing protein [Clostridiales bacterium]MCF8022537.1 DUF1385 domain-containing protein [Clostridiales bacterium]
MKPKQYHYGGQAVIEGVMMRGPQTRSVAVRCPDSTIVIDEKPVSSITSRHKILRWPMIRGVIILFESLIMGLNALSYSANQALGEEEELTTRDLVFTIGIAVVLAVLLFIVVPTGATHFLVSREYGSLIENLVEGIIRIGVFLLYIVGISFMPDIRRVFEYHGAEHKTINAYEAGEELETENVQRYSTFHPRCGTSFIIIVLIVSILVFALLGEQVLWWRIVSRILLLPVVAGVSYELLKLSAKFENNPLFKLIIMPGKLIQKLTTNKPDDSQVKVAIAALSAVLQENRGEENV